MFYKMRDFSVTLFQVFCGGKIIKAVILLSYYIGKL